MLEMVFIKVDSFSLLFMYVKIILGHDDINAFSPQQHRHPFAEHAAVDYADMSQNILSVH